MRGKEITAVGGGTSGAVGAAVRMKATYIHVPFEKVPKPSRMQILVKNRNCRNTLMPM